LGFFFQSKVRPDLGELSLDTGRLESLYRRLGGVY